jgi:replication-associated recombination protein RarA
MTHAEVGTCPVHWHGSYAFDTVEPPRQVPLTSSDFVSHTFVEPDDFFEFKMALRQPGLGVVLEGPSGVGKTTLHRQAVLQDADRLGEVPVLSARRPADVVKIRRLFKGHTGLIAVDDFQRLPSELQDQLADYLKLLADDDASGKLAIVGIPDTAQNLIELRPDIATRVRVFRLGRVADDLLVQMMEKAKPRSTSRSTASPRSPLPRPGAC